MHGFFARGFIFDKIKEILPDLRARSSMDRASASEAGNVGSTPAERTILKHAKACFFMREGQANCLK